MVAREELENLLNEKDNAMAHAQRFAAQNVSNISLEDRLEIDIRSKRTEQRYKDAAWAYEKALREFCEDKAND